MKTHGSDTRSVAARCPAGEVHLLQCRLDDRQLAGIDMLSDAERRRAARLQRPRDRERFVAGRAWLRHTLGGYLGVAPQAVALSEGSHGKPRLADDALQFNLSHSGAVALLAVTRAAAVGVDVEAVVPMDDCEAIARRLFASAEWRRWSALPIADRLAAFYACWTRKEAYVKALGGGLSVPLDGFEVAFEPGAAPALLSVAGSPAAAAGWSMWSLEPAAGCVAAVVAHGPRLTLRPVTAP